MKILIVDDCQELAEALAISLENAGHTVETAIDGVDGLFMFQTGAFDAVLSDWDMPRMNGFAMVTKIIELAPNTKIVMMSGDTSRHYPKGVRMLAKPFSRVDLLTALAEVPE